MRVCAMPLCSTRLVAFAPRYPPLSPPSSPRLLSSPPSPIFIAGDPSGACDSCAFFSLPMAAADGCAILRSGSFRVAASRAYPIDGSEQPAPLRAPALRTESRARVVPPSWWVCSFAASRLCDAMRVGVFAGAPRADTKLLSAAANDTGQNPPKLENTIGC